jgi:hypothetical protein
MLTDLHLLPSNKFASYLVCIGASVAWLATYLVARVFGLLDWAERAGRRAPWAACLAERSFTFVSAVAGVWFWRGVWGLLDYHSVSALSVWSCALGGPALLLLTTSLRTTCFTPIGFVRDGGPDAWDLLGDTATSVPLAGLSSTHRDHQTDSVPAKALRV